MAYTRLIVLTMAFEVKTGVYWFDVPFPDGLLPITYMESKEDGKLLSIRTGGFV